MFSREKLQKFLKDTQDNSKNINIFNKQLNKDYDPDEQVKTLNKSWSEKFYSVEDIEDVEVLRDQNYISDEDNNGIVARNKSQTPMESIFRQEGNLSAIKPNKNYALEEIDANTDEGDIKNDTEDTFHKAVAPSKLSYGVWFSTKIALICFIFIIVLLLGQCFALLPVAGILAPNAKYLRFSYKSLQVIYTIFFICSSSILTLTMLKFLIKVGINAKNFGKFILSKENYFRFFLLTSFQWVWFSLAVFNVLLFCLLLWLNVGLK